jgi:hypothetical protein
MQMQAEHDSVGGVATVPVETGSRKADQFADFNTDLF